MSKTLKVTVHTSMAGDGQVYGKGGTYEVAADVAKQWETAGLCTVLKTTRIKKAVKGPVEKSIES